MDALDAYKLPTDVELTKTFGTEKCCADLESEMDFFVLNFFVLIAVFNGAKLTGLENGESTLAELEERQPAPGFLRRRI